MVRLPLSLQKKLAAVFPDTHEQAEFVAEAVKKALDTHVPSDTAQPSAIGGTLHLFTDGGSRGNPGQAAVGCVLYDPLKNEVIREYGECIGVETNNIAEYSALITGLKIASEFHPNHLICHLDSELVVKQLNGEYRVKMATFTPLIQEINALKSGFPHVSFVYVPREKNTRADLLVNRALDEMLGVRRN
ncbi:ribonuclease HI family protein [Candidatus Peribacteria bacterium]|nr:ribonuclease HI family protein [Candidatus Peribacteria bacterium]